MKFDLRNQQPHVRNIVILLVITIAVVATLMMSGAEEHALVISVVLDIFFASVIGVLMEVLFQQIRYNPYSYNTIYYIGFSLFLLSVLVTHIMLSLQMVHHPEEWINQNFRQIIALLSGSAISYMLISLPFVGVISVLLCISNLSLIRHEGFRFVNILGIILSMLMMGGEILIFVANDGVSGSELQVKIHDVFFNVLAAWYLYFECMIIGVIISYILVSKIQPLPNKDYIIILGCGIEKDGTPTPLLRGRIDRALAFREDQLAKTGKELTFVPSGGRGGDEIISESESMSRYLRTKGIPAERILREDQSTNTFENMKFSKALIQERNPQGNVIFSTNTYHVFRSGIFASKVNMRSIGIGAKSPWYFWPNALVREFVGLLTESRRKQAIIILTMTAIYIFLTLI